MYEIPNVNLDAIVGKSQSLIGVGKFNIQMNFDEINLSIESSIKIYKNSVLVAEWHQGSWPSLEFYNLIDVVIVNYEIIEKKILIIYFQNSYSIALENDSSQYECFSITAEGKRYIV